MLRTPDLTIAPDEADLAGVVNAVYYVVISITKPDRARKAGDMRIQLMICCVTKRGSEMRKLALIVLPLFVLSLISACSSSSNSGDDSTIPEVDISSLGSTTTIARSELFDLIVSGQNNTVTVAAGNEINDFKMPGLNNMVIIESGVSINNFSVSGMDNTVVVPKGSGISFADTGLGNMLIEQ